MPVARKALLEAGQLAGQAWNCPPRPRTRFRKATLEGPSCVRSGGIAPGQRALETSAANTCSPPGVWTSQHSPQALTVEPRHAVPRLCRPAPDPRTSRAAIPYRAGSLRRRPVIGRVPARPRIIAGTLIRQIEVSAIRVHQAARQLIRTVGGPAARRIPRIRRKRP